VSDGHRGGGGGTASPMISERLYRKPLLKDYRVQLSSSIDKLYRCFECRCKKNLVSVAQLVRGLHGCTGIAGPQVRFLIGLINIIGLGLINV
jgi:hypothetical protein